MASTFNNVIVLEKSPEKLVLRRSNIVDIYEHFINASFMLVGGITVFIFNLSNRTFALFLLIFSILVLFAGFQYMIHNSETLYTFDKIENQLIILKGNSEKNCYPLESFTIVVERCTTGSIAGVIYYGNFHYKIQFHANQSNSFDQRFNILPLEFSSVTKADEIESLILPYLH